MIKKITTIKNMAVFNDFDWDATVRDKANKSIQFKSLNIIYGRNYSGKTTLSRILRTLETGELPDKYVDPQFKVEFEDGTTVDQLSPTDHSYTVRVFSEDFVRTHLRVFFDDDGGIAPFAVLGEDNAELSEKLDAKEMELGSEENPGSLLASQAKCKIDWSKAQNDYTEANETLDSQLRKKANDPKIGIKHNKLYGDANYDIKKIQDDIKKVRTKAYTPLSDEREIELMALLNETPKPVIAECPPLALQYEVLAQETRPLVGREIKVSEPIQELLDEALLQEWVRTGRGFHENIRETCGFCGNRLPEDLWNKLDKHFNKESETLRDEISTWITQIDDEIEQSSSLLRVDSDAFYSVYLSQVKSLDARIQVSINEYKATLVKMRKALEKRQGNIFSIGVFPDIQDVSLNLDTLREEFEQVRSESNEYTASLNGNQAEARSLLRQHDVSTFADTIDYEEQQSKIATLKEIADSKKIKINQATVNVVGAQQTIAELKAQMRDERNGAEKVNQYLSHYFGHPTLSLQALETDLGEEVQFRFEVHRDGSCAYNLSEGERGLIAFCYFMARLEDVETSGKKPIIWIDDPVSSFDDNHVFFVHSLIDNYITTLDAFGQIFISTHSLSFLKYLIRLSAPKGTKRTYLVVNRTGTVSSIQRMPKHLEEYATEFHYLFHQIYKCANDTDLIEPNVDVYYNLGNNVRKFLEMYLYFKYPDVNEGLMSKLQRFFGNDPVAAIQTNRIQNEFSHLKGLFERGMMPVDVPAKKKMAEFVLEKIQHHDLEQYMSLLDSIGESSPINMEEDNSAEQSE